jgi:hypothetical protein
MDVTGFRGLCGHAGVLAGKQSAFSPHHSPQNIVMAGLGPAIHVFSRRRGRRGCPEQVRA